MLKDLDIAPEDPAELRAVNRLLADEVKALTLKVEQCPASALMEQFGMIE